MTPPVLLSPAQKRWLGLQREWWVLISVSIGSIMGTMNNTIVNTTLPVIRESFGADLSSIEWVLMAYLLTLSIFLLIFGRLGDIWGHKRVYMSGLLVFVGTSVLCSLSPTEGFLIGARSLQAVGAAMMIANAAAILTRSFPPQRRGQVLGLLYTLASFGILVGPSLGGLIAAEFGWRSVFLVNVFLGIMAVPISYRILPNTSPGEVREPFDILGAGTLALGFGALLLAISKGQDLGWTSTPIMGLTVASLVFLAAFLRTERTVRYPMLDLSLFRSRVFSLAMASAFVSFACIYAGLFLTPFYLMQGRGFSPSLAGQLYSAQPVGMIVTAPISGYLSDRIGSRLLSTLGALVIAAGLFSLHSLGAQSGGVEILLALALLGMGNGIFVGPNANTIMGAVPAASQGVASAIVATARNLGMVFGVAVAGAVLVLQMAQRASGQADPQQVFYSAFQDTFLVMMSLALVAALMSMVKGKAGGA